MYHFSMQTSFSDFEKEECSYIIKYSSPSVINGLIILGICIVFLLLSRFSTTIDFSLTSLRITRATVVPFYILLLNSVIDNEGNIPCNYTGYNK